MGPRTGMAALAAGILALAAAPAWADGITDGAAGKEALLAGRFDEAVRLFSHAIADRALPSRDQAVILNLRANAYLSQGQTEPAFDDLNESLRLADTPDVRLTRAKIYIAQLRFTDAIADLDRALELGDKAADVYALRASAELSAGRTDAALKDTGAAIAADPAYGPAYRTRGHVWLNRGEDDKAIADETWALALDAQDVEARWLRAYAYRYRKRAPDKALADYTAALRIDPADSVARTSRADLYEEVGRYAEAGADYDAWIRQNPKGPFGYWARGRLELVQGKTAAASQDLAEAVRLKPGDPYAMLWLHLARARSGTDDAAELRANAAKANRAVWPAPLVSYLLGGTSTAEVLAKAAEGQGKARAVQLCEARMFLGQDDLARGRKAQGLERLQAAARDCDAASREARLIKAQLQRGPAPSPAPVSARPAAAAPVQRQKAPTATASPPDLLLRGSLK